MNICLVNNLFPPINTGSSFYTYAIAKNLVDLGHNVTVITNQNNSERVIENIEGIKVFRLPVKKLPKLDLWMKFPDFNFSLSIKNYFRFKKILKREKVEIIHQCNNIFDLLFFSGYWSKKLKIPLFCSLMTQIQHPNRQYNRLLKLFEKLIIVPFFVKKVNKFIALDKESVRYINERFKITKNILFIPYMISEKDIKNSFKRKKEKYNITHYRMISLGHVSNLKNRMQLIKSWKLVLKEFPNAKMTIVGGIFDKKTKRLIESLNLNNSVEFTGRVSHSKTLDYVESADFNALFLSKNLPYNKCVGGANFEMMAAGLPCIIDASDEFFGKKYSFLSGKHFISAGSRNPEELAKQCIKLFSNPKLRKQIGLNGQDFVINKLTWKQIMKEMIELYEETIKNTK